MNNNCIVHLRGVSKHYPSPNDHLSLALKTLLGRQADTAWHTAVEDVSFAVNKGENVGIVGLNGAGKSTLLSIISGSMSADAGEVVRQGSIAAVLALGQGMNPQLTGRENAHLFARTLGASNASVKNSISTIKKFSELGDAFDEPMRTYSSGMRARLSFATAMTVEADLLILDETLAVGDLNFRFKCYDLLQERKASDKTMMMVSHNPLILARFCERIIVIDKGRLIFDGSSAEALGVYKRIRLMGASTTAAESDLPAISAKILDDAPAHLSINREDLQFPMEITAHENVSAFSIRVGVMNARGISITADEIGSSQLGLENLRRGQSRRVNVRMANRIAPGKVKLTLTINLIAPNGAETPVFFDGKFHSFRIIGDATNAIADSSFNKSPDPALKEKET